MRSLLALSLSKKFLLLFLTALLIFSALISTAAIARRGGRPLSFTHSPPSADRDKSPPPPQGQTEEYKYFEEAGTDAELSRMSHHRTATTWFFPFLLSPSLPAPRAYVRACVRCACLGSASRRGPPSLIHPVYNTSCCSPVLRSP
ncbi:uncharacterized protein P884DRAFT_318569 [Thermothelomyces heterothallicus CBS 202.75]|uniref:uncharacterized protein n=1 Tax=Thermothelomyces heterothallicus CBS 202.75 TaxID=1149848 RepID=UPI003744A996